MKDKDLGMKNKLTHKLGSVKSLMNQGTGPADASNDLGNLGALMNQGKTPKCVYKEPGKRGVGKLMNQK